MAVGQPVLLTTVAVRFAVGVSIGVTVGVSVEVPIGMAVRVSVARSIRSCAIRVAIAVSIGFQRSRNASLSALVASFVEIGKETEEEDSMTADPPDKSLGIVAVDKEELERVDDDGDKLNHLEGSEILFPPDKLLIFGAHGGHHVVKVHDDVHKSVEQSEESRVATGRESNSKPYTHRHNSVMDDVE